ncbi:MAG TPA: hydrogenase nickel incorporation protein HypB [Phycisphaerae bacterium]|nr:hydrogenase nickel incorporation protein HypB [Phycisphaerae bacterium]
MGIERIRVDKKVLQSNDEIAEANRLRLAQLGLTGVNLIASPGAGKTSLLVATLRALHGRLRCCVVEGDLATSQDADRIAALDVPVWQINTGGACHLSARQVADAFDQLPLAGNDLVLIENVGNLVCPTSFDLGEHAKVALLSMPEGDDKPSKYPGTFARAAAVVVTKADLADHVDFDLDRVERDIRRLNPHCRILVTSAKTGEGIGPWCDFLGEQVAANRTATDRDAS